MQSISPEIIFRGNNAWEKSLPQITKLTKRPLILGRGIHTNNLRNKIFIDLKDQNLSVNSANLFFKRIRGVCIHLYILWCFY